MDDRDDLDKLRYDRTDPGLPDPRGVGGPVFVGRNTTASPVVGHFIAVNPVRILGPQVEGGLPVKSVDTSVKFPVYLLGPGLPAVGDDLICRHVRHRWVAERMAGGVVVGPGNIPGCGCQSLPARIAIHPASEGCNTGIFYSDTLVWQAKPAAYAGLAILDPGYYGTGTFLDGTGTPFQYYFTCNGGQFSVSRVYPGPPARLDTLRWSWSIASPGNTCTPFSLTSGTVFAGGSQACDLTAAEAP